MNIPDKYYGVILAAGLGTRMLPITGILPKPLIEFCGIPNLLFSLQKYFDLGFEKVGINTHHLSNKIEEFITRENFQENIFVSYEKKLLGSGGPYPMFNERRKNKPILASNSDVISSFNIRKLIDCFEEFQPFAVMGLLPSLNENGNSVWVDSENNIIAISKEKPDVFCKGGTFTGYQILSDRLIQQIPVNEESNIIEIYKNILNEKKSIKAVFDDSIWFDVGNPKDYYTAQRFFLDNIKLNGIKVFENFGLSTYFKNRFDLIKISKSKEHIDFLILAKNAEVGENVNFSSDCIVGQNSKIDKNSYIDSSIIISNTHISSHSEISNKLMYQHCFVSIDE